MSIFKIGDKVRCDCYRRPTVDDAGDEGMVGIITGLPYDNEKIIPIDWIESTGARSHGEVEVNHIELVPVGPELGQWEFKVTLVSDKGEFSSQCWEMSPNVTEQDMISRVKLACSDLFNFEKLLD